MCKRKFKSLRIQVVTFFVLYYVFGYVFGYVFEYVFVFVFNMIFLSGIRIRIHKIILNVFVFVSVTKNDSDTHLCKFTNKIKKKNNIHNVLNVYKQSYRP